MTYHLAQVNIARLAAPLDSPQLAGFVAALDPVNAVADTAPGFVWRLQTEDGDATAIRPYEDEMIMVNLSVWASLDTLRDFVRHPDHRAAMAQRRSYFERMGEAYVALWWVPAGHRPTVAEARDRIDLLRRLGPTAEAFTFGTSFPPPDVADRSPLLGEGCTT
ncbi:MAG TPA: DUF3291 domain-containing protein [Acidimicrobiales bacterium]|nr:DUF3291 domain-containing protein [Acidimicrobiales bacterium]